MEKKVIDKADALALIEREEGHFWDHKSAASSGSTIQKIASALANSDGGEFIVGIEDRKKANGIARWRGFASVEDATPVLEALARDVTPPVPYSIDFLAIIGQDQAGITCHVFVRKSESVHYAADKRVYVRRGASTAAIEGRAITDLSLSKGARSYEDQLLSEFQLDDLIGEEELAYFLKSYSPSTAPSVGRYIGL